MTRILIVEDEESFSDPLSYSLRKEGYEVAVADTGTDGLRIFSAHGADLVLLDLMLPGLSGTEVCREIRRTSSVPAIMLTAKDDEFDKVLGLELGADDSVTKPYSARELLARIKAVLRHGQDSAEDEEDTTLTAGGIMMDVERHVVEVRGQDVALPLKEFELLEMLLRNVDRVLTRGQLIDRVWGADYVGATKTLDVHVKRLRAKTEEDTTLTAGGILMGVERRVGEVRGQDVALPLKEFELLEMLLRNVDRVLTRGQLIDRVWGADYVGDTKTLDVHVKRLRAKIEQDPRNPVHLVTVRRLGYKFESGSACSAPEVRSAPEQ